MISLCLNLAGVASGIFICHTIVCFDTSCALCVLIRAWKAVTHSVVTMQELRLIYDKNLRGIFSLLIPRSKCLTVALRCDVYYLMPIYPVTE